MMSRMLSPTTKQCLIMRTLAPSVNQIESHCSHATSEKTLVRAWRGPGTGLARAWRGLLSGHPWAVSRFDRRHRQIISAKTYVNMFEGPVTGNIPEALDNGEVTDSTHVTAER